MQFLFTFLVAFMGSLAGTVILAFFIHEDCKRNLGEGIIPAPFFTARNLRLLGVGLLAHTIIIALIVLAVGSS